MEEKVESITDAGRDALTPPDSDNGVLMRTRDRNYAFLEDDVAFTEIASIVGGDTIPDNFEPYESRFISGVLRHLPDIRSGHLNVGEEGFESSKSYMIFEDDNFVEDVEPHTLLLYALNSDSELLVGSEATVDRYEAEEVFDVLEWNGPEEREWLNVNEWPDQNPRKVSSDFDFESADLGEFRELKADTVYGEATFSGYEVETSGGEFLVPEYLDNQATSNAFRIESNGEDLGPEDIGLKDNTTLALYLLDKHHPDVDLNIEMDKVFVGDYDISEDVGVEMVKPRRMYLEIDESLFPVPYVSREPSDWPYSNRASQIATYLSKRGVVDEVNTRYQERPSHDNLTQEMLENMEIGQLPGVEPAEVVKERNENNVPRYIH